MPEPQHDLKQELYGLLRRDDAIFEFLQDGSLDGIWFWDLERPEEEWMSARFKALFGYEDHEVANTSAWWQANIFPDDLPRVHENFRRHCEDPRQPFDQVVRYRHRDGSTVWVRCRGITIRDASGKPVRMLGAHTDVTALMETRQAAAEAAAMSASERRFREIAESLPQLVWTCSNDGRCNWLGPQWVAYTGIPEAEQLGYGWAEQLHPDDREAAQTAWSAAADNGTALETEFRIRRHDGKYHWFKTRAVPLRDEGGRVLRWFGTNTDIQAERERTAEMELEVQARTAELARVNELHKAVLNATGFGIIGARPDGIIEVFNAGAELMLGYRADEMVGRHTPEVFHDKAEMLSRAASLSLEVGKTVAPGFELFAELVRGKQVHESDWTYVRKDGSRLPVSLSISARRDTDGTINGFVGIARDISLRRQAERARDDEQQRFRKLAKQVPGILYQYRQLPDGSTSFPYASDNIVDFYGLTPAAVREDARLAFERVHPDDRERLIRSNEISARTLEPWQQEYRVVLPDGTVRWLRGEAQPEREPDGGILWHGYVSDVTASRAAEREAHEKEARFRAAFEYAGIGKALVGLDGQFLDANPAFCAIVDYPREQLIQLTFADITHPDDLALDLQNLAELTAGRTRSYQMDKRYLQRGGRVVWVRLTASIVRDQSGAPLQYVAQVEDINHRRLMQQQLAASEERMRLFAEHAPASVAMFDEEMRYLVVSRQWVKDYKLEGRELIGRSHYEIFPEITDEWKAIHRRCQEGAVERAESDQFVRADGTGQWLTWEVRPWYRTGQAIGGIVMFTQDITERKKLENSLARARDQALESSRLKSEFLATMSHEIRTPMNAVIGMAELLMETRLDAEQMGMARTLAGGAESLLRIINDILDFSRIESGRLQLDVTEFDLRGAIEQTVQLLAPHAREKGITFDCRFEPPPPARLWGDGGRVRQVVTNLIGNAIKFTERGGVSVRVAARPGAGDHLPVRIEIKDTGVGIPFEAQERLFQPFVQADGSTTRRFGGTGLGLAISRQLVELMGGEIGFESSPEQGAVFWVELNFARRGPATLVAADAAWPPASAWAAVKAPLGLSVLVVEDNEANQKVARMLLAASGCSCVIVADGADGIRALESGCFDVVLMDCQMPELDGFETTRRWRSIELAKGKPRIPIIAVTAYARPEDRTRCLAVGMDDFLTKPIRSTELREALRRLSKGKQGRALAPDLERGHGEAAIDEAVWQQSADLPGRVGASLAEDLAIGFFEAAEARLAAVRARMDAGDMQGLAMAAHALAGDTGVVGGLAAQAAALELERLALGGDAAGLALALDTLASRTRDLRSALEQRISASR